MTILKNHSSNILALLFFVASFANSFGQSNEIAPYTPIDQALHDEIVLQDQKFFDAYNHCDIGYQASIYADTLEFLHDKSGLSTSKKDILTATKNNICGKVTRELVEGTIEVYPINNYGAVEIGYHKFHNNQEPDAPSKPSKFIIVWNNTSGKWRMAKVISLH